MYRPPRPLLPFASIRILGKNVCKDSKLLCKLIVFVVFSSKSKMKNLMFCRCLYSISCIFSFFVTDSTPLIEEKWVMALPMVVPLTSLIATPLKLL